MDHFNVMFGIVPDEYEGDADRFLSGCNLVDDEVKEAIATIMRKCPCAVVFGDKEHKIDATAGGYQRQTTCLMNIFAAYLYNFFRLFSHILLTFSGPLQRAVFYCKKSG